MTNSNTQGERRGEGKRAYVNAVMDVRASGAVPVNKLASRPRYLTI
jgi:hypothetical protein